IVGTNNNQATQAPAATAVAVATAKRYLQASSVSRKVLPTPLILAPSVQSPTGKDTQKMAFTMPPPSQVYLCKLCYAEHTNIHSARNHMCDDHSMYLSTADTWEY
ncbi:hypothetical protein GGI04_005936, partial [Coemansia thaxteri]